MMWWKFQLIRVAAYLRLEWSSVSGHLQRASPIPAACSGPCPAAFAVSSGMEMSPGSLFWHLMPLIMKRIVLISNQNCLCSISCPVPSNGSISSISSHQVILKSLLFSQAKAAQFHQPLFTILIVGCSTWISVTEHTTSSVWLQNSLWGTLILLTTPIQGEEHQQESSWPGAATDCDPLRVFWVSSNKIPAERIKTMRRTLRALGKLAKGSGAQSVFSSLASCRGWWSKDQESRADEHLAPRVV